MEGQQNVTIASTWKFDVDGVNDIQTRFKGLSKDGVCRYETTNELFTINPRKSKASESTAALTRLLATFVEDEKDDDLLGKPKVSRIVAPTAVDVMQEEHDMDAETEGVLIDDIFYPPQTAAIPMTIQFWHGNGGSVAHFEKMPYDILAQLSAVTGATVVFEKEDKRIRVSSSGPEQAKAVIEKLESLGRVLALVTSPQVANVLNVGKAKEYFLRLAIYKTLNEGALRRILVDPTARITSLLHRMFSTSLWFLNPQAQACELRDNLKSPPKATALRKGGSKLWTDFKFPELGDATNVPDEVKIIIQSDSGFRKEPSFSQDKAQVNEEPQNGDHPFLSAEKTSRVNKWITEDVAVETEARGSEPNNTPSTEQLPEPLEKQNQIAGLKKRRAVDVDGTAIVGTMPDMQPADANGHEQDKQSAKGHHEVFPPSIPFKAGLDVNDEFEEALFVRDRSKKASERSARPGRKTREGNENLIDVVDITPTAVPQSTKPLMSFSQKPLIPGRPSQNAPPQQTPRNFGSSRPLGTQSSVGTNSSSPLHHARPSQGFNKAAKSGLLTISEEGQTVTGRNSALKRTPNERVVEECASKDVRAPEREQESTEVDSRKFFVTMRQKTSNATNMKPTKAQKKAQKDAVVAEAWGMPLPSTGAETKKAAVAPSSEPSKWKKDIDAVSERVQLGIVKDIFLDLMPVLEAAKAFPGKLSLKFQFGMVLVYNPQKEYTDTFITEKQWNKFLFRPQHGLRTSSTHFTNRLTSSGSDVDHIVGLTTRDDGPVSNMFSQEISTRSVQYEFYCQAKNNEQIVICVDQTGDATVYRPEATLGTVNVHCACNIWDMRVLVSGKEEYTPGMDEDTDAAVQTVIGNLYVFPNRTQAMLFTRIPSGDELSITKVLMRRSTTHRYLSQALGPIPDAKKPLESEASGLYLEVTEVHNLKFEKTSDKTLVLVREVDTNEIVENHRLWYETSIFSSGIDRMLHTNKNLELGASNNTWDPSDILGAETKYYEVINSNPQMTEFIADMISPLAASIGTAGLGQMYRVANQIVEKIDGIGWANAGPGVDIADDPVPQGSVATRSSFAAAASQRVAPTVAGRLGVPGLPAGGVTRNLESLSARHTPTGQPAGEEFW